jgi:RimJ/RimL family protein N-acetyltransferase
MRLDGRLREHLLVKGAWRDDLLYSVLEEEWPRPVRP